MDNRAPTCTCLAAVSGKGGTGKSTVCCGLAFSLAAKGRRVLLIDADASLRCLDLMLGVGEGLVYDLSDVLSGGCDVGHALIEVDKHLELIAAPYSGQLDGEKLRGLVDSLRERYDFIIIDSTAGVGSGFEAAVMAADSALTVTTPDAVAVRDVGLVSGRLRLRGKSSRLIINRFMPQMADGKGPRALDGIIDASGSQLIGIVPVDARLASHRFAGRGSGARALRRIASRLCSENVRLPKLSKI